MGFLPEGLGLAEKTEEPIPVKIIQARETGPWFTVHVRRLSPLELKVVTTAFASKVGGARPGQTQTKEQIVKADRVWSEKFAKRVLAGWDDLTIPNFQALDRGKTELTGDVEKAIASGVTIPFSIEAAVHLMTNAWPKDFSDLIFEAVQNGADAAAEEDEGKDESSDATA